MTAVGLGVTVATAAALFIGDPVRSATIRVAGDPEPLRAQVIDGRISFSKDGPYLAAKAGACIAKDLRQNMTVYYNCQPSSGGKATWGKESEAGALPHASGWTASPYLLSAATWQAGHADDVWAYGDTIDRSSGYALTFWMGSTTVVHSAHNAPVPGSTPGPSTIPLPASALLLGFAVSAFMAMSRGRQWLA